MTASADDTYNGWPNRETWALISYVDNDEGWQHAAHGIVAAARRRDPDNPWAPTDAIKDYCTTILNRDEYKAEYGLDQPPELTRYANDIGSLWRIDWRRIADALLEAVDS